MNLTQKIGPLPAWAWAGVVAVGIWFFVLRGRSAAPQPGTSPSGQATTDYSLGYAQGLQASGVQGPPPGPTPGGAASGGQPNATVAGIRFGNVGNETGHDYYGGNPPGPLQVLGQLPFGTPVQITGPPTIAQVPWQNGTVPVPVYPLKGPAGQPIYMQSVDVAPGGGGLGIGGPGPRKHAIGSRSKVPWWHDAHPLVGAPVRYDHFVRAVGGPSTHQREIARVARQAGVHPARVAMLNPVHTGMIRVR